MADLISSSKSEEVAVVGTVTSEFRTNGMAYSLEGSKRRVPFNVVSNISGFLISATVSFFITPYVVHCLGNAAYGIWSLSVQTVGYLGLMDFGMQVTVARYAARHLASDERETTNKLISTGLLFSLAAGTIVLSVGLAISFWLPYLLHIPSDLLKQARLTFFIVAFGTAYWFPAGLIHGFLPAMSRYDLMNARNILVNLARGLMVWFFLAMRFGLVTLALITVAMQVLGSGLDYWLVKRQLPWLTIRLKFFHRPVLYTLLNFSAYAFIIGIATRVSYWTDNIVVGMVLGPVAVAFYAVGGTISEYLRNGMVSVTGVLTPMASQMDALDRKHSLRRLHATGSKIALSLSLAGIVPLVLLGKPFLLLWMGPTYAAQSTPILILTCIGIAFYAVASVCWPVLYALAQHRVGAWLFISEAIVNLVLSLFLVRLWGAMGVACGTLIPAFFVELIILPMYTCHQLTVSYFRFYQSSVFRPVIVAVPFAAWCWLCLARGYVSNWPKLAVVVLLGLIIYFWLVWTAGFMKDERHLMKRILSGFLKFPARPKLAVPSAQ